LSLHIWIQKNRLTSDRDFKKTDLIGNGKSPPGKILQFAVLDLNYNAKIRST